MRPWHVAQYKACWASGIVNLQMRLEYNFMAMHDWGWCTVFCNLIFLSKIQTHPLPRNFCFSQVANVKKGAADKNLTHWTLNKMAEDLLWTFQIYFLEWNFHFSRYSGFNRLSLVPCISNNWPLVHVTTWCRASTDHYLNPILPTSLTHIYRGYPAKRALSAMR